MEKVAIYYIATNQYITFFEGFMEGIDKLFPNKKKKVVVITDSEKDYSSYAQEGIEIEQKHIDHYFWPIPTLFKMYYIKMFLAEDCDYHFYCNANMKFEKEFTIENDFDCCFMVHYLSNKLPLYVINNGNCNDCVIPPSWAKCHISPQEIPMGAKYCQGGFWGGRTEKIIPFLDDINNMIKDDLKHNIIPIWHDETYLNKFLLKNYWNDNNIGNVKIVNIREYVTFLEKDKYFDKFNI
jgi:hypothetical protein